MLHASITASNEADGYLKAHSPIQSSSTILLTSRTVNTDKITDSKIFNGLMGKLIHSSETSQVSRTNDWTLRGCIGCENQHCVNRASQLPEQRRNINIAVGDTKSHMHVH